jgi:hypothetical protein
LSRHCEHTYINTRKDASQIETHMAKPDQRRKVKQFKDGPNSGDGAKRPVVFFPARTRPAPAEKRTLGSLTTDARAFYQPNEIAISTTPHRRWTNGRTNEQATTSRQREQNVSQSPFFHPTPIDQTMPNIFSDFASRNVFFSTSSDRREIQNKKNGPREKLQEKRWKGYLPTVPTRASKKKPALTRISRKGLTISSSWWTFTQAIGSTAEWFDVVVVVVSSSGAEFAPDEWEEPNRDTYLFHEEGTVAFSTSAFAFASALHELK